MGGKRVCLGKTFAEVSVRFVVPLVYHHLELSLVDPTYEKPPYSVGGDVEVTIPMKVAIRNKVQL